MSDATSGGSRKQRFLRNVLWNWADVAISTFSAFLLAPLMIRRLGDDNFGIWALTASMVEYYWLLDFGMRGATVRFTAHHHASDQPDKVNEVINTSFFTSLVTAPLMIVSTFLAAPYLASKFQVADHALFAALIAIVVSSWALGAIGNTFSGALEGFQRFDCTSQAYIFSNAARSLGAAALLLAGYGVLQLAYLALGAQILTSFLNIWFVTRAFPAYRCTFRLASMPMLRQMMGYGVHSVFAAVGQRVLNQSTPLLLGYFLPAKSAGYYYQPTRLLEYSVEGILRIGNVTNPNAAALVAEGRYAQLERLATDVNRYGLALYLPFTIFLAVYAREVLSVWISPGFAAQSAPVLLALLAGVTLASAAQYNSSALLFGIGAHQSYAKSLLVEAVLTVALTIAVIPAFGVAGAAWVRSGLMVANRGLCTAWLVSRAVHTGYLSFLSRVYLRPLALALPVAAGLYWMKTWLPGHNWGQLILAGGTTAAVYLGLAYRFCLRQEHQSAFRQALVRKLPILKNA